MPGPTVEGKNQFLKFSSDMSMQILAPWPPLPRFVKGESGCGGSPHRGAHIRPARALLSIAFPALTVLIP